MTDENSEVAHAIDPDADHSEVLGTVHDQLTDLHQQLGETAFRQDQVRELLGRIIETVPTVEVSADAVNDAPADDHIGTDNAPQRKRATHRKIKRSHKKR